MGTQMHHKKKCCEAMRDMDSKLTLLHAVSASLAHIVMKLAERMPHQQAVADALTATLSCQITVAQHISTIQKGTQGTWPSSMLDSNCLASPSRCLLLLNACTSHHPCRLVASPAWEAW
jgi:hypothetical protein